MRISIKIVFLMVLLNFASCSAQKQTSGKINSEVNEELLKSRKSFFGKLDDQQNKDLRKLFEIELQTKIPENQSVLINYYQYGNNCFANGFNKKDAIKVIENSLKISARISDENNTVDFFVYSEDVLNKKRFENNRGFKLDKGFFSQYIFTLKENCNAFFVIKPDGSFMKYYGTDYYSIVQEFLKKK